MTDTSPDYLRGFIIPKKFSVTSIWDAESNYTQQGNRTGDPVAQQKSRLSVRTRGEQTADTDIQVITRRAGHVGTSAFTWKNNDLSSGENGRDAYNSATDFEVFKFCESNVTNPNSARYPYPLDLGDGTLLIAVVEQNEISGTANRAIRIYKRTEGGVFSSVKIYDFTVGAAVGASGFPNLLKMPDGSILCIFLEVDALSDIFNAHTYRSNDSGATWTQIGRNVLDTTIDVSSGSTGYDVQKMRAATLGGQILLIVEATYNDTGALVRNRLHQWASVDGGGSFKYCTVANRIDDYPFHSVDLYADELRGVFALTYIASTTDSHYMEIPQAFHEIQLLRKASKYTIIEDVATVATGSTSHLQNGDHTSFMDADGAIFVIFRDHTGSGDGSFWMKTSETGETFDFMNKSGPGSTTLARIYDVDDPSTLPHRIKAVAYKGAAVLASNWSLTSTLDQSGTLIFLGGYGNVNLPIQTPGFPFDESNRAGFDFTYYPMELPSDVAGMTVAGASTTTLSSGKLSISSNTLQTPQFKLSKTPTQDDSYIMGRIVLETVAKGDFTVGSSGQRRLFLEQCNGWRSFGVHILIGPTKIRITDATSGATLGSDQTIDGASGIEILYSLQKGFFSYWYRQYTKGDKVWITGLNGEGLATGSLTVSSCDAFFEHNIAPSTGSIETNILQWVNAFEYTCGQNLGTGFSNPSDLMTCKYSPIGRYKWIGNGIKLSSISGPGFIGDEYRIATRYEYPIDSIFHDVDPTPRTQWRSAAVSSGSVPEQMIALKMDDDSTSSNSLFQNEIIGISLHNVNFRVFTVEYYDTTAGAWQVAHTVDTSEGLAFSYTASGNTIQGIGGGDEPYIFFDEFKGAAVELTIGGSVERYRIISNSAGKCGGSAYQRPIFELDGRPTGNGTCRIVPKNVTSIINLLGKEATSWAIRIASNPSVDNDFRIGNLLIGSVIIPGRAYSWGRSIAIEANVSEMETPDRVRYSRSLSPSRRRVSIAWSEGVDISRLMGASPTPDTWSGSTSGSAEQIATENDVPYLLEGLLAYLEGSVEPLVYVPSIKRSTSGGEDTITINRRADHILCNFDDNLSLESVLGNESISTSGEIIRVSELSLTEII